MDFPKIFFCRIKCATCCLITGTVWSLFSLLALKRLLALSWDYFLKHKILVALLLPVRSLVSSWKATFEGYVFQIILRCLDEMFGHLRTKLVAIVKAAETISCSPFGLCGVRRFFWDRLCRIWFIKGYVIGQTTVSRELCLIIFGISAYRTTKRSTISVPKDWLLRWSQWIAVTPFFSHSTYVFH